MAVRAETIASNRSAGGWSTGHRPRIIRIELHICERQDTVDTFCGGPGGVSVTALTSLPVSCAITDGLPQNRS